MSSEMIAGLSTLVTALVSAVAGAVVLVLNARTSAKQRETAEKQNEYEKLLGRYEKEIQRREAHSDHMGEVVDKLKESNARLRERYASAAGKYDVLYQYARRQFEYMKQNGIQPEPPPMQPETVQKEDEVSVASSDSIDMSVRKVAQASEIIKKTRTKPPAAVKELAAQEPEGKTPNPPEGEGESSDEYSSS